MKRRNIILIYSAIAVLMIVAAVGVRTAYEKNHRPLFYNSFGGDGKLFPEWTLNPFPFTDSKGNLFVVDLGANIFVEIEEGSFAGDRTKLNYKAWNLPKSESGPVEFLLKDGRRIVITKTDDTRFLFKKDGTSATFQLRPNEAAERWDHLVRTGGDE